MHRKVKSVLFISNCQRIIYEKAFSLLIAEDVNFQVISTNDIVNYNDRIVSSEFDIIIGPSSIVNNLEFIKLLDGTITETLIMEPFLFDSYHPDICYVKDTGGNLVRTKMHDYNSIIILCGFLLGLSTEEVSELFSEKFFHCFGYYNLWNQDIKRLQAKNTLKLNWAYLLRDESRRGCFMFTFNHPNSSILFEISKQILKELNIKYHELQSNIIPSYLANGPVWPVYPEVAERFTIKGSYFFKPAESWYLFNLKTFIETSFEIYRQAGISQDNITVFGCGDRYDQVMAVVKGKAS